MSDIKVSVVMPVYNAEKTVGEALDSLLCQTEKDIEIICVDDGSKDNSLNILNEYAAKDNRIKVLHQENLRAGVARNNGLKISRGGYVIFLDSDDFFEPDLIEATYKKAIATNSDVVLFELDRFNNQTKEYEAAGWHFKKELVLGMEVFSRSTIPDKLFQITHPGPGNKLFSRRLIVENDLQFPDLRCCEDVYFVYAALALASRIASADKVLAHYRVNQTNNLESTRSNAPIEIIKAYELLYELFNKENIYTEIEKSFVNFVVPNCIYNIDTVHTQAAKMELYREAAKESFRKKYLSYSREFYYIPNIYDRLFAAPNIVSCYDKRHRDYSKNGFKAIKGWQGEKEPKVSVIIPIYNTAPYLDECLDSIQHQSLKELEIICIDDGSTDNSLDIVKTRAEGDDRICIFTEENSGMSVARNKGIENSHGKYIYFMDSDDILRVDALEKLYLYAENNSLEMVLFDCVSFLHESPSTMVDMEYYGRKANYLEIYSGIQLFNRMLLNNDYLSPVWSYLLKKDFVISNNLKFAEGIIHEDELFTPQCAFIANRTGYIHESFYKKRYREGSIMQKERTFENAYGCFYGFIKLQSFFAKMFLDDDATFVATRMEKHLLSLARERYMQCNAYEKEAVRGLNWQEKLLFESYICDWYNERGKADALAVSNSELNNSTTWKVGRLIMYIPCKTKNKVKGLVKGKLRSIL